MRILKIRFLNLNSLVGEWEIDLNNPAFLSDGLFAITGPTGAGKSTILDAVCLALYGRTPRLDNVSQSTNEILSRQTGQCFAELTFETGGKRYRCFWSQHKAGNKPAGTLQPPRREISDAETGEILESKMRDADRRISEITGMDFDRFTRSVLLAQGGFALFLQSAPDERSPLLEQITGTEIYSRLSILVHERRSVEQKKLEALEAELAGLDVVDEDRILAWRIDLATKLDQESHLKSDIEKNALAADWLRTIDRLETEEKRLSVSRAELQTRLENFRPDLERKEKAEKALLFEGGYHELQTLRGEQQKESRERQSADAEIPALRAALEETQTEELRARERLEAARQERESLLPVLRRVREIDVEVAGKTAALSQAEVEVESVQKTWESLRADQETDTLTLSQTQEKLQKLTAWQESERSDEVLGESLAGLLARRNSLRDVQGKHLELEKSLGEAEGALIGAAEQERNLGTRLAERRTDVQTQKESLELILDKKASALQGKDVPTRRRERDRLKDERLSVEASLATVEKIDEAKQKLENLTVQDETLVADLKKIDEKIEYQTEKIDLIRQNVQLLENQLALSRRIQSFEEARSRLQDGLPCPLCGSPDHPFARGNLPADSEPAMIAARAEEKRNSEVLTALQIERVQKETERSRTAERSDEILAVVHDAEKFLSQRSEGRGPDLRKTLEVLTQELQNIEAVLDVAETLETQEAALRRTLELAQEELSIDEREFHRAETLKTAAETTVKRLRESETSLARQIQTILQDLRVELAPFGFVEATSSQIDEALVALQARRDLWASRLGEKESLERSREALEQRCARRTEEIVQAKKDLEARTSASENAERERGVALQDRRNLLGEKNPQEEENRLDQIGKDAEQAVNQASEAYAAARLAFETLEQRRLSLTSSLTDREKKMEKTESAFQTRLWADGFADEKSFLSARIDETERRDLELKARSLRAAETELSVRESDNSLRLKAEKEKRLTELPLEDLEAERQKEENQRQLLLQEVGALRQKLDEQTQRRKKIGEKQILVDAQKRELSRWSSLHNLIGSADGKKFRNFAQGLTFEILIAHANRQLQRMTDRYLLARAEKIPLELNVIDNYQAGESRSTKNLSGGESFLVSLALALGLSRMTSHKVRIDSLFLDEGFGTLDEDALDTALETLAGLQREGKLIGVISHVPQIKERISAQIQVFPLSGGRSELRGPGCRRIE